MKKNILFPAILLVCCFVFSCGGKVAAVNEHHDIMLYVDEELISSKEELEYFKVSVVQNCKKKYKVHVNIPRVDSGKKIEAFDVFIIAGISGLECRLKKWRDMLDRDRAFIYIQVEDRLERYKTAYSKTLDHYSYQEKIKIKLEKR